MPSVCHCPFCGQSAAIPENLDSQTAVRCPLCQYEFAGDAALLNAVEAPPERMAPLPPELIAVPSDPPATASSAFVESPDVEKVDPAVETSEGSPGLDPPAPSAPAEEAASEETSPMADERVVESAIAPEAPVTQAEEAVLSATPQADPAPAATGEPATPADASPVDTSAATAEASTPVAEATAPFADPEHETPEPGPLDLGLEGPDETVVGTGTSTRRGLRKRHPIRTAIGVVVSGLLGLAATYGLMTGLSKLGFSSSAKPAATSAKGRSPGSGPESLDDFPGLDENRFNSVPNNVQSSQSSQSAGSVPGSGRRKGP